MFTWLQHTVEFKVNKKKQKKHTPTSVHTQTKAHTQAASTQTQTGSLKKTQANIVNRYICRPMGAVRVILGANYDIGRYKGLGSTFE